MQHLSRITRLFVLMNSIRFFTRALSFPFQVGFMGEDDLGGSTPQFSPQMQTPHPTRDPEGSDELDLEEYSSELTDGNETGCITITRKFLTMNLHDH